MTLQLLHSCLTFFSKSGLSWASYRGVWFSGSSSAIVAPPPPFPPPPPPPPQPTAATPARASTDTTAAPCLPRLRHLGRLPLFSLSSVMRGSFPVLEWRPMLPPALAFVVGPRATLSATASAVGGLEVEAQRGRPKSPRE